MSAAVPEWTKDQADAIHHTDGALLLSAAAGSGKTAVLAERCAYLVCDAPEPCEVDELLVLTFTRAAAAEMRERIERAIRRRVDAVAEPSERLLRQLRLLDRASITTLDGFCGTLVRSNFHLVGVDPAFTILAPEDASLLRADICNALVEAAYDGPDADAFKHLLDAYFGEQEDTLVAQVIAAHGLMQSIVDPDAWAARSVASLTIGTPSAPSELAHQFARVQHRAAVAGQRSLEQTAAAADRYDGLAGYAAHARSLAEELRERAALATALDFDALAARLDAFAMPRLPNAKKDAAGKEAIKKRIDGVKESMKSGTLHTLFRWTWRQLAEDLEPIQQAAEYFFQFVAQFGTGFAQAKRAIRALDFADTETFALRILRGDAEQFAPSPAAIDLQQRFRHVLVDECQDINPLQDAILRLLSTDRRAELTPDVPSNLFQVGDVKQSIYRFRLAEPRQFVARAELLRAGGPPRGRVIDLQANFRSRPALLEAANDIFRLLMTRESADVDYDATQELRSPGDYADAGTPSFAGKPIELYVLPKDAGAGGRADEDAGEGDAEETPDRFEREVNFVARRIRQLVCVDESQRPRVIARTAESTVARPIRFGDIAVLLRSARHKASVVADQLRAAGVPVHADDTTGFFQATEVQDVLSLLRVLSNRRQDIALAALLRSPLAAIDDADDALAEIRIAYPEESFHRAVARYASERDDGLAHSMRAFCATLDRWRQLGQDRPIVDALGRILDETNYATFCRALPGGAQRTSNLDELLSRAAQFDNFERQGLDRFLRFLHELEAADQLGRPPVATGSTDVVRVLTVHKSKGLEFPVVIVPDLGKAFNERSLGASVMLDRDLGIGMTAVDLKRRVRYPSAASTVVREHARRQALAEEIRVLYVALTRAREHLILVGTGEESKVERWREDWSDHVGPLPDDAVQSARTPLDWLGPIAAITERRGLGTFDVHLGAPAHAEDDGTRGCGPDETRERATQWIAAARRATLPDVPDAAAATVVARLTYAYPHDVAASHRATRAVTDSIEATAPRIVGRAPRAEVPGEAAALAWPEAYEPPTRANAVDIGAATHRLLQSLDFGRRLDADDVREQLAALVARRAMSEADAALVNVDAIAWLGTTEVADLIRRPGTRLLREQSLSIADPIAGGRADDRVLVRGRLDALVVEADALTIVDYKTDRIEPTDVAARAAFYAPQLRAYADAVSRLLGRRVTRAVAVFLTPRAIVDVAVGETVDA